MAKVPAKRRGITLAPQSDAQDYPDLFADPSEALAEGPAADSEPSARPAAKPARRRRSTGTAKSVPEVPAAVLEQLSELERLNLELAERFRRQDERMEAQNRLLAQQREQIARQTRRLESLESVRGNSGRLGMLLMVLSLVSVGALVYHTWPQVQGLADDWNRISAGAERLAPELQALRGQLYGMGEEVAGMGVTVGSLRSDLSGVQSELGTLRERVAATPAALPSRASQGVARNTGTLATPYPVRYPGRPW